MEQIFCKDKKDFCDGLKDCTECQFAKGNGVISGYVARDVLATLFGLDYDLDRLRELVEADQDGRCAVFPCKPSDVTVYQLRGKKHARGIGVSPRHVYCATVWAGGHYQLEHQGAEPCRDRDFGRTWFLDEKSANAAMEKKLGLKKI